MGKYYEINKFNNKRQFTDKFCNCNLNELVRKIVLVATFKEGIDGITELIFNTYSKENAEQIIKAINLYLQYIAA